jgi:hypothetical protein
MNKIIITLCLFFIVGSIFFVPASTFSQTTIFVDPSGQTPPTFDKNPFPLIQEPLKPGETSINGVIISPKPVIAEPSNAQPSNAKPGNNDPKSKGYYLLNFKCTGGPIIGTGKGDDAEQKCIFKDFMTLFDRIITLLLYTATILAVISFVYAGYLLLFSGGSEEALKSAKHIFTSVLVGLVLAYGAWIIVRFVLDSLGVKKDQGYTLIDGIK